jgi:hypothetical protein
MAYRVDVRTREFILYVKGMTEWGRDMLDMYDRPWVTKLS